MDNKIFARTALREKIQDWKKEGKKVVFTNGVFDLIHPGHVDFLYRAKQLGDVLVVGLNTDESARRLCKGPSRPLQEEHGRARIMSSLGCVDAVTLFDEDTPRELIETILPDVITKGGEYRVDQIMGHDIVQENGGEVCPIPMLEGHSTTAIEQRIIEAYDARQRSSAPTSLVQIVNEYDEIVGHKKRSEVHPQNDIYRVSSLWLENSKGEVLIAQRSYSKDKDPGRWCTSAAGTLEEGETYDTNIYKEAEEEIGLTGVEFTPHSKEFSEDPRKAFSQLYVGLVDKDAQEFNFNKDEIIQVAWVHKSKLAEDINMHPKKYTHALARLAGVFCR